MSSQHAVTCPDETTLAAFADGTLPQRVRIATAAHVAGCRRCLDALAMLARLADSPVDQVDPALRERARKTATVALRNDSAGGLVSLNWRVPAAAALLLSVASGALLYQLGMTTEVGGPAALTRHEVRTADIPDRVVIRHPGNDDVLAGLAAWDAVAPAIRYLVSVTDEDGALVWQTTVRETTTRVSATLDPGRRYYFMVKALLPDGKWIPGRAVRFRAPPR
jgi:hypothetical protein